MTCEYYSICPLRRFEKEGKLGYRWKKEFCSSDKNWENCKRFIETKKGIVHPDDELPDGSTI
ncbi:uracil-DNA glycosylase [Candidatus Woesearchaeota archaeon]|nr:uracil-DNA glycosylase [Candidatus Woesearchaeota archaeon]